MGVSVGDDLLSSERALREGGNAVVNIQSYYKKNDVLEHHRVRVRRWRGGGRRDPQGHRRQAA